MPESAGGPIDSLKAAYPRLELHRSAITANVAAVQDLCTGHGIALCCVVKGVSAHPDLVDAIVDVPCRQLGSSRIWQLESIKRRHPEVSTMLLRIPMLCELEAVLHWSDISLQSERATLQALDHLAQKAGRRHGVLLMMDLGDLREGVFSCDELVELAVWVETGLPGLYLSGIGTNLGCYGAIKPDRHNLGRLVDCAHAIETRLGRKLDIVSGGASSSLPLLLDASMPEGINHLRVGEAILVNRDLPDYFGVRLPGMASPTMILKAQVVEVQVKPSHPVGTIHIDAFGDSPTFVDRGIRRRALVALGKQDIALDWKLIPLDQGVSLVGSSSDHLILDVSDCTVSPAVGDILCFGLYYGPMLHLCTNPEIRVDLV